jgi:hypothetical protein
MEPGTSDFVYEILIEGVLDSSWADWLDGIEVLPQKTGETILIGPVADQSALHGIINRLHNLGLVIISINRTGIRAE